MTLRRLRFAALAVCFCFGAGPLLAQTVSKPPLASNLLFKEAPQYSAVDLATYIASGDFNEDGSPDVAVLGTGEFGGLSVAVLLNKGDGAFRPPVTYPVGTGDSGITVGDFNNDGHLDIVVASGGITGLGLYLMLGNGDGSFNPPVELAANVAGAEVAAGDFNNDGNLDLLAFSSAAGYVAVLFGEGNGTFQPPVNSPINVTNGTNLSVGDFNNDGNLDIIAIGLTFPTPYVSVLLGDGHGSFGTPVVTNVPTQLGLVVADFNRDGFPDIAVGSGPTTVFGGVAVLMGKGDGSFNTSYEQYPANNSVVSLAVGDFNGDGVPDIIAGGYSNSFTVLLGKTNGGFSPATQYFGAGVAGIVVGDFNGDGKADLVTADPSGGTADVLIGNGAGGFNARRDLALGAAVTGATVADFNGDSIPDLAATLGNVVGVFLGKGNASFNQGRYFVAGTMPTSPVAADFNGDHKLDLAVANVEDSSVSILMNAGDGSFLPPVIYPVSFWPVSVAVGDFNRDGYPDLAVVNAGCEIYELGCDGPGSLSVLLNNGDGHICRRSELSSWLRALFRGGGGLQRRWAPRSGRRRILWKLSLLRSRRNHFAFRRQE